MRAKHSAHPHAGECQPLGYSFQLMNNSDTFLMFNSVSEKLLTHALCQLPIAFITPFIAALRANEVMLHVRSAIITKQLGQQWEFLPALSAGLLESCYSEIELVCVKVLVCVSTRADTCSCKTAAPLVVNVPWNPIFFFKKAAF